MMEIKQAVVSLSALAHEHRLGIFRLLVQAGAEGVSAGELGRSMNMPPATLSFHLQHLRQSGLIGSQRQGRSIIYSANYDNMQLLLDYMLENCCGGDQCGIGEC